MEASLELPVLFWPFMLIVLGFGLIALELFIPSGGVLAVLSAAAFVGAVVFGFLRGGPLTGSLVMVVLMVTVPTLLAMAVRWWPETPLGRMILIQRPTDEQILPHGEGYDDLESLVGEQGVAKSPLLPSGVISLGGRTYEAVSDGEAIDSGQAVRVVAIRERRIIVRAASGTAAKKSESVSQEERLAQPLDAEFEDPFGEPLA